MIARGSIFAAAVVTLAGGAKAQDAGEGTRLGGLTVSPPACHRPKDPAPPCATQRLDEAARAAEAKAVGSPTPSLPASAGSPPLSLGVPTPMALGQQLGPNLGRSAQPWRPTPPPIAPSNLARTPR